jgi:diaminohydroxyphosphoribosylaminopyrimidine deaminase/5-amino-6-(5-phosphoribosylamino)uracil reductase
MEQALDLARRGEGKTRPNPPVGAVLVRSGQVVGKGYHRRAGGPHAEVHALRQAGSKARGATLYITLEPCSTTGRTPPCTEAVLAAGVHRVVVGARDPNPEHAGRGLRMLRRRGVKVTAGVLGPPCLELIRPFTRWIRTGRPYVTLKLALTLDGRIADRRGRSKWITGPAARARVQELRRRADAIMVGAGTVRADNPSLLPRPAYGRAPWRIVVASTGRLPERASVLGDEAAARTIVTCRHGVASPTGRAELLHLRSAGAGVSLRDLLAKLGRRGLLHVLCEGGGRLAGELARSSLVDEYVIFYAPSLLGGHGARAALAGVDWLMPSRPRLTIVETERLGEDLCVRALPSAQEE